MPDLGSTTRPEFVREIVDASRLGVAQKPLHLWEKIYQIGGVRRIFLLGLLALLWQLYARHLDSPLLFPTFGATISAFAKGILSGVLLSRAWFSIKILLWGYTSGLLIAMLFTVVAITTRIGNDLLSTLTAMFNPLPAIALLPLALLWFGLGNRSLVFVLIQSVLWPMALNIHSGFMGVSNTLRMIGRNYGLSGFGYVSKILIPAAFPSVLSGMKIGWAFAWRTLIAAELVFGVASGSGGLGWYIYENKNELEIANVFAGLLAVILIGLMVENFIFAVVERNTVRKWGMQA